MNNLKTFILMGVLTFVMMTIGEMILGPGGWKMALIFSLMMNLMTYWYSDKMVLKMYRAEPVSESNEVYLIVRELCEKANLPMPKVCIINQSQPNAFATGRNPNNAAVCVTRGLLDILDRDELSGVIAHELGHVNNRDILIGTISATFAGAISYLATVARWGAIFGGGSDDDEGANPIALILIMILAPLSASIIQMAISRTREYKADEFGGELCGNPRYLARALEKLQLWSKRVTMDDATESTAHMFIVSPLSGDSMKKLFSTHPSTEDRIEKLNEQAEFLGK